MKTVGYMVIEYCEEFEQPLGLEFDGSFPRDGLLCWTNGSRAVFPSRKSAREAITRTEHFRLAFNDSARPEKRFCKIVPLAAVPTFGA